MRHTSKTGVTLIEILLVLAVVGIFLALSTPLLRGFRARLELQSAQRSFVETLNRARSESRRTSVDHSVTWTNQAINLKREDEVIQSLRLSPAERISLTRGNKNSGELIYSAPYGRASASSQTFELEHEFRADKKALVIVYGLTGKVKAVAP